MHEILREPGEKVLILGNEAIARGLIEGGINVAASYPGTPSTEIMETLIIAREEFNIYTEWSVNEKVAAEVAIAASICGLRSAVSMKGVGVNVASEPFQAFTYMGADGGIVLISADDPSCHSSHTEQDNRYFAREAHLPIFEPSDVAEAKNMAKMCLIYSEKWSQPVFLRTTTMISHSKMPVVLGDIQKPRRSGRFKPQPTRWVNLPQNVRKMKPQLIARLTAIQRSVESIEFNWIENDDVDVAKGIIACGVTYNLVKESLDLLNKTKIKILKLGTPYPLPMKLIETFLNSVDEVLVVEEVDPFIEPQIGSLANKLDISVPIKGKEYIPKYGELDLSTVTAGICKYIGIPNPLVTSHEFQQKIDEIIPKRSPILCPGCGHRNVFYAINIVEKKLKIRLIKPSDIGCYTLGYQPPLSAVDTHFCMGASIGVSSGFSKCVKQKIVCTIGDSTFFHAGIPPLINTVFNKSDVTIIILDNQTTAMTGYQPHPGVGLTARKDRTKKILIEDIVNACGVDMLKIVNVYDIEMLVESLKDCVTHDGVSVIIAKGGCITFESKMKKIARKQYYVDTSECTRCLTCIDKFGCPAIRVMDNEVRIDEVLCMGCGVCSSNLVCRRGAIKNEH
jgi:indolepyruvate ferredoxin oxidoreductase alpha subunit